ncbi:MAG: SDR family oxidoreductase [Chloroflexi bacterium]|nr:SDR family oxidoreductase [Chloroflexota bacterium]
MKEKLHTILVTGGAGYIGSVLVPKLLVKGYHVKVLDLYIYGENALDGVRNNPNLEQIKGDIRDRKILERVLPGTDCVIHLACISNDPSFELDAQLGKSINYDAFLPLVKTSKRSRVKRFIYASSSSVYGIKEEQKVTEDMPLEPLTDYSKYKALCEQVLRMAQSSDFTTVSVRSATVCGYSPRMRLDVIVNILTNHAVNTGRIEVLGGPQKRPNINIEDLTDLYVRLVEFPDEKIAGKVYNVGFENFTVSELAEMVRSIVQKQFGKNGIQIVTEPTNDPRSYHISSEKIERELGWRPTHTIEDAIRSLCKAFKEGKLPDSMNDVRYFNVKAMQALQLK